MEKQCFFLEAKVESSDLEESRKNGFILKFLNLSQQLNSDTMWTQNLWTKYKQIHFNKTLLTKTGGRLDTSCSLLCWSIYPEESWPCLSAASYAMIGSCMPPLTLWTSSLFVGAHEFDVHF